MTMPHSPKWPSLFAVMRHAESCANRRREQFEQSEARETHLDLGKRDVDVELTDRGRRQARDVGRYLNESYDSFDAVYVSPHARARQTAALVLKRLTRHPREVITEERLRERDLGILEGLTRHGIEKLHPEEIERKLVMGKYYYRPPGGESYPDVNLRVHSFLGTLVREHAGGRVLVVTHSVVVLCFRRLLERMDEQRFLELDLEDEVKNASLLIYEAGSPDVAMGSLVRRAWNLAPWERSSRQPAQPAAGD